MLFKLRDLIFLMYISKSHVTDDHEIEEARDKIPALRSNDQGDDLFMENYRLC